MSEDSNLNSKIRSFPPIEAWNKYKQSLSSPIRWSVETVEFIVTLLLLLIIIRQGVFERRFIPSGSMLPSLQVGDQLIIEKVSLNLHKIGLAPSLQRGDIIVFYPPPEASYGQDLKKDFANTFVRLTGLSSDITIGKFPIFFFLPRAEDAYIKRIVGLPEDQIEIKANDGIYINGQKLAERFSPNGEENYTLEKPNYNIKSMSDIALLKDSLKSDKPIVVPANHYFVLGDNHNNSNDGHVWGFVPKERIIGRAYTIIWRDLGLLKPYLEE